MIVRLSGTIADIGADSVVLERDGLAYEVLVPQFAVGELAAYRGRVVTLYTAEFFEGNHASGHLVPRMLGFLHPEDRAFFTRFLEVKGIGPRKALRALCEPIRRIASWIHCGDVKSLARLPGIGPRAAEMIVATLKGKMGELAVGPVDPAETASAQLSPAQHDALEILVAWGDARNDAQRWLERAAQLHPEVSAADEWVRLAYRVKTGAEG